MLEREGLSKLSYSEVDSLMNHAMDHFRNFVTGEYADNDFFSGGYIGDQVEAPLASYDGPVPEPLIPPQSSDLSNYDDSSPYGWRIDGSYGKLYEPFAIISDVEAQIKVLWQNEWCFLAGAMIDMCRLIQT